MISTTENVEGEVIPPDDEEDKTLKQDQHCPPKKSNVIFDDAEVDASKKHSPPEKSEHVTLDDAEVDAVKKLSPPRKSRHVVKKTWSPDEIAAVKEHLKDCLVLNRVPGKCEALVAIAAARCLNGRSWKEVKYCAYNMLQKKRRALV